MISFSYKLAYALAVAAILLISGCAPADKTAKSADSNQTVFPGGRIVDLSYEFSDDTVYWVNAKEFKKEAVSEGRTPGGFYYSAYNYSAAEHGGTHIDSPVHFAEGRLTVDKIPLEKLIGPGIVIDVSKKASADRNYLVSVADLESWEAANGKIADGSIVLLKTGFGRYYPDKEKYLGTAKRGDDAVSELSFPGLGPEAAKWLIENRKPNAVGIDTASIDFGRSQDFKSHVALMSENIPAFENVANLDKLPLKGFHVIALPMKIKGGSGAPLRIIAILRPEA